MAAAINKVCSNGRLSACAPVQRQCCRGRPACRGTGGWRSRSRTKLPHLGRHGTVPISTPHPGPCSRSKSITTHLVLGCKASSSRHHLGLASKTQAHRHRKHGQEDARLGSAEFEGGKSISRPTAHLPHLCNLACSTNTPVPYLHVVVVWLSPAYPFSPHHHDQPASQSPLSPSTQDPSAAPTSSPAS